LNYNESNLGIVQPPNASPTATIGATSVPVAAAELIRGVSEIRALPEVAQKVRDIAADPKGTVADLAEIITSDPALASKLLKLANSAFYGLPTRVACVRRAIVVLGFKTVQNLALAGALCGIFRGARISPTFTGYDLWKHCLGVAVAARKIAKATGAVDPDEEFLAGITHDVGLLAIPDARPEALAAVVTAAEQGTCFLAAEREALGTDHTEVGLALTSVWRFPEHLRLICRYHHAPVEAADASAPLIHTVHLADGMCGRKRIGMHVMRSDGPACAESREALGLRDADLAEIAGKLAEDIQEAERVFS